MELFIVHDATRQPHLSLLGVLDEVADVHSAGKGIVSDACAQTIASWWHSPDSPLSTVLSTMGQVDRRMTLETFASEAEYASSDVPSRDALDALKAYIEHHIAAAPASYQPCACRDCFDLTVGIVGEMCPHCEDAGCEYDEECSRDDAYGEGVDMIDATAPELGPGHDVGNHGQCITETGYCD